MRLVCGKLQEPDAWWRRKRNLPGGAGYLPAPGFTSAPPGCPIYHRRTLGCARICRWKIHPVGKSWERTGLGQSHRGAGDRTGRPCPGGDARHPRTRHFYACPQSRPEPRQQQPGGILLPRRGGKGRSINPTHILGSQFRGSCRPQPGGRSTCRYARPGHRIRLGLHGSGQRDRCGCRESQAE